LKKLVQRLLAGAAVMASAAFAPVAHAADLGPADKAPVLAPAPAGVNWTGFYIGGNVGYSHSTYSASNVTGTASADLSIFGGPPAPIAPATTAGLPSVGAGNGSFTGGGQIGFNYQIGPTVLGLEADFQGANLNGSLGSNGTIDLPVVGAVGVNSSVSLRTDWYATVRGRIGHPFGAFLPYVTGGLAIAETKAQVTNSATTNIMGIPASGSSSDSMTKTLTGYAVGAGLEYALGGGWSIKGEYLHLGFGSQSYDFTTPVSGSLPGLGVSGTTAVHADVKTDFDVARVGVNYRF
jgi:outer membrane immunogenic protein